MSTRGLEARWSRFFPDLPKKTAVIELGERPNTLMALGVGLVLLVLFPIFWHKAKREEAAEREAQARAWRQAHTNVP